MFTSQRFIDAWDEWKLYKKQQHNFTYKSEISEKKMIKQLFNMAAGNESLALQIIDHSIANAWEGFWELPPQPTKAKAIPVHQEPEKPHKPATKEQADAHMAAIKETLRKNGGIGKPAPVDVLKQRFTTFKKHENLYMPDKKQILLADLKKNPDKYKEEIKYMER